MADIRVVIQKPISGGGGAVDSVNGKQGVVVIDGTEIELIDGGGVSVTQAVSDLDADVTINSQDISGNTQDIGINTTDISNLQTGVSDNAISISNHENRLDNPHQTKTSNLINDSNITGANQSVVNNSIDTALQGIDLDLLALNSGKLDSVVAGSNVEVNNVDPLNPIVSAFPTTTAGLLSRTYFTGDTVTTSEGTFYKSNRDDKGTVATATQTVNVNDNQKAFFSQDLISDPYPIDTTIFAGAYSGVLNGLVSSNGGEQKFYVEIYKTDIDGVPIASGIAGSPVGDLGVTVVAIAESGLIDLQSGNETQFSITADLKENLSLLSTNLIRYHVAAEKVGTTGGAIDVSISYGFDHVSHLDIPVQALTNTVINTDSVEFPSSATQYDINRNLKTNIDFNTQGIGVNASDITTLQTNKADQSDLDLTNVQVLNNTNAITPKIEATNYATFDTGGTLKARLDGTDLYLTNDGSDA